MKKNDFIALLKAIRIDILTSEKNNLKKFSDFDFEELVYEYLTKKIDKKNIIYKKGSTSFPDIVYLSFGIEIKTTNKNSWVSLGNSIMEGTKRETAKDIYIFFLKKGGTPDIKIRKYEECLSDIKVTHSPRYEIKMDLDKKATIFHEMGTTYESFVKSTQKIKLLRNYYKKINKGSYPWWIDPESGETVTSINFRNYSSLEPEEQSDITIEILSLFPEIIGGKYGAAAVYLITKYGVYNKSFRDMFSAGGQIVVNENIRFPHVFKHIKDANESIESFLNTNRDILNELWDDRITKRTNSYDLWIKKIFLYIPWKKIEKINPAHTIKMLKKHLKSYITK